MSATERCQYLHLLQGGSGFFKCDMGFSVQKVVNNKEKRVVPIAPENCTQVIVGKTTIDCKKLRD